MNTGYNVDLLGEAFSPSNQSDCETAADVNCLVHKNAAYSIVPIVEIRMLDPSKGIICLEPSDCKVGMKILHKDAWCQLVSIGTLEECFKRKQILENKDIPVSQSAPRSNDAVIYNLSILSCYICYILTSTRQGYMPHLHDVTLVLQAMYPHEKLIEISSKFILID